jgi:hypothetical protein
MKAEPESRIEKGKDVKFSIDDLKACAEPEAWDGKLPSKFRRRAFTDEFVKQGFAIQQVSLKRHVEERMRY